jgi:hypothetical protein
LLTAPNVGSDHFGFMFQDVSHNNLRAPCCEQARFCFAHAMGTTSDDRNFVLQAHDPPSDWWSAIQCTNADRRNTSQNGIAARITDEQKAVFESEPVGSARHRDGLAGWIGRLPQDEPRTSRHTLATIPVYY